MADFYELAADSIAVPVEAKKLHFGIGWDPKKGTLLQKIKGAAEEMFSGVSSNAYDLNIGAIIKHADKKELVFYGKKVDEAGAIHYLHDDRTGGGEGEDEGLDIVLNKLPEDTKEVIVFAIIYNGNIDKKNFGMVENFFVQAKDANLDKVIYRNDSDVYQEEPAKHSVYVFAKVKKDGDTWKILPQHRFSDEDTEQDLMENL